MMFQFAGHMYCAEAMAIVRISSPSGFAKPTPYITFEFELPQRGSNTTFATPEE